VANQNHIKNSIMSEEKKEQPKKEVVKKAAPKKVAPKVELDTRPFVPKSR